MMFNFGIERIVKIHPGSRWQLWSITFVDGERRVSDGYCIPRLSFSQILNRITEKYLEE